jgi:hypothetical protein
MQEQSVCNKCGKTLDIWDIQEDFTLQKKLEFGTKYDRLQLKLRLCCKCMENLIDECEVSPLS